MYEFTKCTRFYLIHSCILGVITDYFIKVNKQRTLGAGAKEQYNTGQK